MVMVVVMVVVLSVVVVMQVFSGEHWGDASGFVGCGAGVCSGYDGGGVDLWWLWLWGWVLLW